MSKLDNCFAIFANLTLNSSSMCVWFCKLHTIVLSDWEKIMLAYGPLLHSIRPENLKSPGQKKIAKSNNSISQKKFFDKNPFFAISKMAKNQFLNWEKV